MNKFLQLETPEGAIYINSDDIVAISETNQIFSNGTIRCHVYTRDQKDPFNIIQRAETVFDMVSLRSIQK